MTTLTELREAVDYMKEQSGTGSKERKQERFREIYSTNVAYILAGERYDDSGVGERTVENAAENVFGDISDSPTISEALAEVDTDGSESVAELVYQLDEVAELAGNEQQEKLEDVFDEFAEPSIVSIALLQDEKFGLGTSAMKDAYFDGTRDERKRASALTRNTVDFISRVKNDSLPTSPEPLEPFDPMLAHRESRMPDDLSDHVAQLKLDGCRILIHVDDGDVRAYTRNCNHVTNSLPELRQISWPSGGYIFDGEVIASDGTYSTTTSRIGKKPSNIDSDTEMNFALFDLVYSAGDMTQNPYSERYAKLERLVETINDDRVYSLETARNIDEVREYAIQNDYEGIIVKSVDGKYKLGQRDTNWVKSKNTAETVDLVAREFVEGDGKFDGTLGKIRLETADGENVGYVGSGFSCEQRDRIWRNQDEYRGSVIEIEGEAFGPDALRFPIFSRWRDGDGSADTLADVEEILPEP